MQVTFRWPLKAGCLRLCFDCFEPILGTSWVVSGYLGPVLNISWAFLALFWTCLGLHWTMLASLRPVLGWHRYVMAESRVVCIGPMLDYLGKLGPCHLGTKTPKMNTTACYHLFLCGDFRAFCAIFRATSTPEPRKWRQLHVFSGFHLEPLGALKSLKDWKWHQF